MGENSDIPSKNETTTSFEKEQIKQLIEDALKEKIVEVNRKRNQQIDVDNALINSINEFLDCFIILGFDLHGNPHTMSYAKNMKDASSLVSLLLKFVPAYMARQGYTGEEL